MTTHTRLPLALAMSSALLLGFLHLAAAQEALPRRGHRARPARPHDPPGLRALPTPAARLRSPSRPNKLRAELGRPAHPHHHVLRRRSPMYLEPDDALYVHVATVSNPPT